MSKVLVDRDLLERIASDDEGVASSADFEDLKRVLAQPAEAEGVEVVGYAVTWIRVGDTPEETVFMSAADFEATGGPRFYSYREPLILQSAHLAALSVVTAERDRLREAFGECIQSLHDEMLMSYGGQKPHDMHPVTRRNYDRDMAEIAEYRAAIEAAGVTVRG